MITPVLLCGGSGTRLWPLSRKSYPKQFVPIVGDETLFQASARRLSGPLFHAPLVLTNTEFRFIVTEQLMSTGLDPAAILIEPIARNTAAPVLAAAIWLAQTDPDALMLVAPCDHVIPDIARFQSAVAAGIPAAQAGQIVTFGIRPTHPETGYGYLDLTAPPDDAPPRPIALRRFVEKPDLATAQSLLEQGHFLWNAGIFLFSAATILAAFRNHAPQLLAPVREAVELARPDLGFLRLAPDPWQRAADISLDFAVMEPSANLTVIPFDSGWNDLGGWDAVWREAAKDPQGVATSGAATAIDCQTCLLRSESDGLELVGIGLTDIIAIAMPDAVLVAHASRAQDVRQAVAQLKAKQAKQAESLPKVHRPWGWFESLVSGDRFQVKRIQVAPGAALSLQSHHHRAEHWIVVEGTARVTIDTRVRLVTENESVYVPLGAIHRLENPGKVPMVLIEVQSGRYLGEDDIQRFGDAYARP